MAKENEDITLDELVVKEGQEFDATKSQKLEGMLYAKDELLPNSTVKTPTADDVAKSKEDAELDMLSKIVEAKNEREKAAFEKMSDNEKIKDYIRKVEFYRNTNDFYHKHFYQMSGAQQRNLKRKIESALPKTISKLTQAQRDEILVEANKLYDNQVNAANETANKAVAGNKDKVTSLSALMH